MRVTTRRPGVTLMEVMIATAILTVGMLAIMALFPIGAVNFARALNQDRSATHGVNSDAMFGYYWKKAWVERDRNPLSANFGGPTGGMCASTDEAFLNSQEPMLPLLDFHPLYSPTGLNLASSQPSFPVLVDPIGWQTKAANPAQQGFVAGVPVLPVRTTLRRAISIPDPFTVSPPNPATSSTLLAAFPRPAPYRPGPTVPPLASWNYPFYPQAPAASGGNFYNPAGLPDPYQSLDFRANIRLTTLLDDLTYDASGEASAATGQLERAGRYSVAWLIQRTRTNVPTDVDLKVLVFAGRSVTDTPSPETAFGNATTTPGTKTIIIPLGGQAPPALRNGAWLGFSMVIPNNVPPANPLVDTPYPTLDFYRVVGVNDDIPDTLVVEVENPIKQQNPNLGNTYTGVAVVFDNLFEVFERGTITPLRTTTK
jgi:prepilin-type N-terminal cleavage/methylation domain-containing protein